MIKSYKDLEVYKRSFDMAMGNFWLTRNFPRKEVYSLTSQVNRSARSISVNVTEGPAKRNFGAAFKQHLINSLGSRAETENWLRFALKCDYPDESTFEKLTSELNQIGKMLHALHKNWKNHE